MTETWLRPGYRDQVTIGDLRMTGYSFLHVPRHTGYGGVGIMYKDYVEVKQLPSDNKPTSFECMEAVVSPTDKTLYKIVVVYHPPPKRLQNAPFLHELGDALHKNVHTGGRLLIVSNFNFHVDDPANNEASNFLDLINSYNLLSMFQQPRTDVVVHLIYFSPVHLKWL